MTQEKHVTQEKQPLLKTIFGMMINPAGALRSALASSWMMSAAVSGLAFGLFFAQTGLDLVKTGQKDLLYIALSVAVGLGYGLLLIPLLGVGIWVTLKIAKSEKKLSETISAFCLSYSGALIYGIVGIIFSLVLGWKTSVAFGVTGVLWAIGPIMVTIRDLTKGKTSLSIMVSTIVSAIILISWSWYGNL